MPSILKKRGKGIGAKYPVQYTDEHGRRRQVKGFTDRRESMRLGVQLEEEARARRLGIVKVDDQRFAIEAGRSIEEHVRDFERHMLSRDITPKQARQVVARTKRFLAAAGVATIRDLTKPAMIQGAKRLRDSGKSNLTCRHHVRSVRQFSGWLVEDRRMMHDPLAGLRLSGFNPKHDQRHARRALSDDECNRIIAYLSAAPALHNVPAVDRLAFFRVLIGTGFRGVKEAGSLTTDSFHLDGDHPSITLTPKAAKNGKAVVQPIAKELADELRPWLASKLHQKPVFGPKFRKPHCLLKIDWKAAGVAYVDAKGRFADTHALRHTYITRLIRSGVDPKTVQTLARHATISQTMDCYAHVEGEQQRAALGKLPKLAGSAAPVLHAGDTNGADVTQPASAQSNDDGSHLKKGKAIMGEKPGKSETHLAGLEPATFGSVGRRCMRGCGKLKRCLKLGLEANLQ